MLKQKYSQASIITVVLIILLVLAGIVVVWNIVLPMIQKSSQESSSNLEAINTRIELTAVKVYSIAGQRKIDIQVEKSAGQISTTNTLKFLVYYKDGNMSSFTNTTTLNPLETKVFTFDIANDKEVEKVSVAPIDSDNRTGVVFTQSSVTCISSNCTLIGKQCGSWNDGCRTNLNCGTCAAGYNCNSTGQCISVCVPNCAGKQCGDDGCSGSCGTCAVGKNCNSTGQCVIIPLGPVAYYSFEGNANDLSGNNYHGTVYGASLVSGKIGQAYSFDGINDYIDLGKTNKTLLSMNNKIEFTVSAWVYNRNVSKFSPIVDDYVNSNGNKNFRLWAGTSASIKKAEFLLDNNSGQQLVRSSFDLNNSQWYHIVGVKNATHISIYINGILNSIVSSSGVIDSNETRISSGAKMYLGYSYNNAGYLNGIIDEVKIWNYSLSPAEVLNEYNRVS